MITSIESDEHLLKLNQLGLIPGPQETAEAFKIRADYCLTLKTHLSNEIKANFATDQSDDPAFLAASNRRLSPLYDIAPTWIPVFFSNYKLPFWQGGCAWIFQVSEHSPIAALIQLRRSLLNSSHHLKIYSREELLTHELVHVGRMAFQEPRFEEMLAYHTAHSRFRRWFGPLLQSSVESVIFILLLGILIVFDIFLIALNRPDAYLMALWLKLIPLGLVGYAMIRLWKRHQTMHACLVRLNECLRDRQKARAVLFRLTDHEITTFAEMTNEEIQAYGMTQAEKNNELRWRVILKAYFPKE